GRRFFLDRPAAGVGADAVLVANAAGARRAVEHLLGHGHRRIAFLGDDLRVTTARERLGGYRAALSGAGIDEAEELISVATHPSEGARESLATLLALPAARRPTALLAGNNR